MSPLDLPTRRKRSQLPSPAHAVFYFLLLSTFLPLSPFPIVLYLSRVWPPPSSSDPAHPQLPCSPADVSHPPNPQRGWYPHRGRLQLWPQHVLKRRPRRRRNRWFPTCFHFHIGLDSTGHCSEDEQPSPPLDGDDLLREILVRLPPQPSSLPRASLVCKRWRGLVSDPGFSRRFRFHRRRNPPPILGCLVDLYNQGNRYISFVSTLDPPNRIPAERFSLHFNHGDPLRLLGCCHGLVLLFSKTRFEVLVWDPVTGERHRLAIPPGFYAVGTAITGAVLRVAGDGHHFLVALAMARIVEMQHGQAFACFYSSETGLWSNFISTPLPSEVPTTTGDIQILASHAILMTPTMYFTGNSAGTVLVGDSLYWLVTKAFLDNSSSILELDLNGQSLNVIPVPVEDNSALINCHMCVMRAKGGGLGFLYLSNFSAQFWKRKTDCHGVASWQLGRAIALDKLLSLKIEKKGRPHILGFASQNNVVFLWTRVGVFMLQLESLQFKKIFEADILRLLPCYYPYESVYTAGIGGEQDGAELFQDAED